MTRCAICDEPLPPRWRDKDCPKCTKVVVEVLEEWAKKDLSEEMEKELKEPEAMKKMSFHNRKFITYAYQPLIKYRDKLPLDMW